MSERDNAGRTQDGRFAPGVSGNPAGMAKGTRHKATRAIEALLEGESEELTRTAINLAKSGDTTALRLCLERLAPARKSRPVQLDLPKLDTPADVAKALSAVLEAVAAGEIDPDEGAIVAGILETKRKSLETVDMDERLKKLENHIGKKK